MYTGMVLGSRRYMPLFQRCFGVLGLCSTCNVEERDDILSTISSPALRRMVVPSPPLDVFFCQKLPRGRAAVRLPFRMCPTPTLFASTSFGWRWHTLNNSTRIILHVIS